MKKLDLHIYLVFAFFLAAFIIGSFFDFQINDALFHDKDTFGLVVSVIGTTPGYGVMAFIGGGLLYFGIKKELPHLIWKIICLVMGVAAIGLAIYFSGREFFGPNGFDMLGIARPMGYLISLPVDLAIGFLGFHLSSKTDRDNLWIIYLILLAAIGLTLIGGVTLLKGIMHRPRFRSLQGGLDFHSWWDRCSNYKDYMEALNLPSEEFKSFPSGHAGSCGVLLMASLFLPYINKKYETASYITFYIALPWTLLVSFARMYVGAHYLSDVSMGVMISILFFFVAKIVLENLKLFNNSQYSE